MEGALLAGAGDELVALLKRKTVDASLMSVIYRELW
jgi:hypothetical protein